MNNKNGRTTIVSIGCIALMALVLICVGAGFPSVVAPTTVPDTSAVTVIPDAVGLQESTPLLGAVTVSDTAVRQQPVNYEIKTAAELMWVLTRTGDGNTYYLRNDFDITADLSTDTAAAFAATIDGADKDSDGKAIVHTLSYRPNTASADSQSSATYGGLFGVFGGTLQNVNYVFSGRLSCDANASGKTTLYYGGLAGKMTADAKLINCTITCSGTVSLCGNKDKVTMYAGGLTGLMDKSRIENCVIGIGGAISTYAKQSDDDNLDALSNTMYAGGLAGMVQNNAQVVDSDIAVSGNILTHENNTKPFASISENDDTCVQPAGGLFGAASGVSVTACTINVSGRFDSTAGARGSKNGVEAGGVIGLVTEGATITISQCRIDLNAQIAAENTRDESWLSVTGSKLTGAVYKGGIIGRFAGSVLGGMSHCVLHYGATIEPNTDNTVGVDNDIKKDYYGYIAGNGTTTLNAWVSQNVWTVLSCGLDEDTQEIVSSMPVRQATSSAYQAWDECSRVSHMYVYGGGWVDSSIDSSGQITLEAKQQYSPFYGWMDNVASGVRLSGNDIGTLPAVDADGNAYTRYIYRPGISSGKVVRSAVFLTTEIKNGGNLVQWAEEMNNGLNYNWVTVRLVNDVTLEKGNEIVRQFDGRLYGTDLDGVRHTLTIASGASIYGSPSQTDNAQIGLIGVLKGTVQDIDIVYAGKMYGGNQSGSDADGSLDDVVIMGTIAGVNRGTIQGVDLTISQAAQLITLSSTAIVGGVTGQNYGTIAQCRIDIDGQIRTNGNTMTIGGVVGENYTTATYRAINVQLDGKLNAHKRTDAAGTVYVAGFAGTLKAALDLKDVVVSVRDVSNFDGDVLCVSCAGNSELYAGDADSITALAKEWRPTMTDQQNKDVLLELWQGLTGLTAMTDPTSLDIAALKGLGVSMTSYKTYYALLRSVYAAYNTKVSQSVFTKTILDPVLSLDISAPCGSCKDTCHTAVFVAGMSGYSKRLDNTWVLGSYKQYPADSEVALNYTTEMCACYMPYFETSETMAEANAYGLNGIYVRDGYAEATMTMGSVTDIRFAVPAEDSAHVFTGWYTTYGQDTMVDFGIDGSYFVPGVQSGQTYYSGVISNIITSADELRRLATTTNAGQDYADVTFALGADITVNQRFAAIGTGDHPFRGTLDGKGHAITFAAGFVSDTERKWQGLFGCLGENGCVKQITINITAGVSLSSEAIFGAVAAVNKGVIGQDSSSQHVVVVIGAQISGAHYVGGIVGDNRGVVKNAEVVFEAESGATGTLRANAMGGDASLTSAAMVGGAVAYNQINAVVKNTQVSYRMVENDDDTQTLYAAPAVGSTCSLYAGGVVAYNLGNVYSCVVNTAAESDEYVVAKAGRTDGQSYAATLVGYNQGGSLDALWAVYLLDQTAFALPYVENGRYAVDLINGDNADVGNRLIRYGYGTVVTEIYDNTSAVQTMGGTILFSAQESGTPFYNYTTSLLTGETVAEASGANYMPAVGGQSVNGSVCYAVFADNSINSVAELYAMASLVNSGFSAYVNYLVDLSGSTALLLSTDDSGYAAIGRDNAFVGAFDGNGYTIEISAPHGVEAQPLFGTIAATSVVRNISLRYTVGTAIRTAYDHEGNTAMGVVAAVNLGTISGLTLENSAVVSRQDALPADYAGGMVGINKGSITHSTIVLTTATSAGIDVAAAVYGNTVGGIAGYNGGTIGTSGTESVRVTLSSGSLPATLGGLVAVGGIAGANDGTIQGVGATLAGRIGLPVEQDGNYIVGDNADGTMHAIPATGDKHITVGGIAGTNAGRILAVTVSAVAGGTWATEGALGGVVGTNGATGTVGVTGSNDIVVNWQATVRSVASFGGICALNKGDVAGAKATIGGSITATEYAGGAIGRNEQYAAELEAVVQGVLQAVYAGGAAAYHDGIAMIGCAVTVDGTLGGADSKYVGGIVGYAAATVKGCYAILSNDVVVAEGGNKGLACGYTTQTGLGINSWAAASNRVRTEACSVKSSGFNVLKLVSDEAALTATLTATGDETYSITFTASAVAGRNLTWYRDIATLQLAGFSGNHFTPAADMRDQLYHACYYDLEIGSAEELTSLYQFVNSADLFAGVMFRLGNDLVVTQTMQPIGNQQYPFTGIFEGNYHTITLATGSVLSGSTYSGLFGYVADEAQIRNLILDVQPDVLMGNNCAYSGALAGRLEGNVSNVAVHLGSAPYSRKQDALVGGLAGWVGDSCVCDNVWVVTYNGAVAVTGNDNHGHVNELGVLGSGTVAVRMDDDSLAEGTVRFVIQVVDGLDFFDNWYTDIATRTDFRSDSQYIAAIGEAGFVGDVYYKPKADLTDKRFTLSFISLIIRSQQDFVNFAVNINRYGDQGAMFSMDLGTTDAGAQITELTIDLADFAPIGTPAHPFGGTFDGSIPRGDVNSNTAYTIIVKGDRTQDADYCGLFGYVSQGAVIRNLVVRADSQSAQTIGYNGAIYTGFLAGYMAGTLENVAVVLQQNTRLVNIHDEAIGGVAGVITPTGAMRNTWLVLPENSTINAVGGYLRIQDGQSKGVVAYYPQMSADYDVCLPSIMYLCGEGTVRMSRKLVAGSYGWEFGLTESETGPAKYGFVDRDDVNAVRQTTLWSAVEDTTTWNDRRMLALFLDPAIQSYDDLVALATMLNEQGRSYLGVEFYLTQDILFPADAQWIPIGGMVQTAAGSGEYKQVAFAGAFNGAGHKIVLGENVTCTTQYAGLFGMLADTARISNVYIESSAILGGESTQYAGVLAGVDNGATLTNVIVKLAQKAQLNATIRSGRVAVNTTPVYDAKGELTNGDSLKTAVNTWVLCYNSRYNVEQTSAEQAFVDSMGARGYYGGGVNVATVIAGDQMDIEYRWEGGAIVGVRLVNLAGDTQPVRDWYTMQGGSTTELTVDGHAYTPADNSTAAYIYASYLTEAIATLEDFVTLAINNNNGNDLYGLTFVLGGDIVIDRAGLQALQQTGYTAIGTARTPFNATLDGQGYSITLADDVTIGGEYAGIVGVLGEDGTVCNCKLLLLGTLGDEQSLYAGAVAYMKGRLNNVIIDGTKATLAANGGLAFGYDERNLCTNSWVIVNADNQSAGFGGVQGSADSTINRMREIGMGQLSVDFVQDSGRYYVRMANDTSYGADYAIRGWYSSFEHDYQLSKALKVTAMDTDVTAGTNGTYIAADDIIGCRYEVVIMSTVITTQQQLISLADDVNKGGYSFENTSFTLGADITIDSLDFTSIGTTDTPFRGTFSGSYNGAYYVLTIDRTRRNADGSLTDMGLPLFGVNYGRLQDVSVRIRVDINDNISTIGVLACYNYGTIDGCMAVIEPSVLIDGAVTGGLVGQNDGTVSNCVVRIAPDAVVQAKFTAGGMVAVNNGRIEGSTGGNRSSQFAQWAQRRNDFGFDGEQMTYNDITGHYQQSAGVYVEGTVRAESATSATSLYAGGGVGVSQGRGEILRLVVSVAESGLVTAQGPGVAVGGLVGRSSASLQSSVALVRGQVEGTSQSATGSTRYVGYFVGNIQGTAANSWLVVNVPPAVKAVGNGSAINVLQVGGNGVVDSYIDADNNIIFCNITQEDGAALDGWYINSGTEVPSSVGNVDGNSFRPNNTVVGRTVNVVFINTSIYTVEDLLLMANTVNEGLFAPNLVFTLMADLVIDSSHVMSATIGNQDNAFKHKFYGNGHTITIAYDANQTQPPLHCGQYGGLFGRTASTAQINDLTVVYTGGSFGDVQTTDYIGGLVGENNGRISNCTVVLGTPSGASGKGSAATLYGIRVGGIAGSNGSTATVQDCVVYNYGTLYGVTRSNENVYVGGVTGFNQGTIDNVQVYHQPSDEYSVRAGYVSQAGWGTTYVGGISGNNGNRIAHVYVQLVGAKLDSQSTSSTISYAGGAVGSNMGVLEAVVVDISAGSLIHSSSAIAGGLAGANNRIIRNAMVQPAADGMVTDSAVASVGADAEHGNVWVYGGTETIASRVTDINNMIYRLEGAMPNVWHNPVDEIWQEGYIVFHAALDAQAGLRVFADAHTQYRTVLLDSWIDYDAEGLRLLPAQDMQSVWVRAEIRRTALADQTELKALSKALTLGGQAIEGVYTLAQDIVITGDFAAIGTADHPFTAKLAGNYYSVTFAEGEVNFVTQPALFGTIRGNGTDNGCIEKLVIRHYPQTADGQPVNVYGVAATNGGGLKDVVVYLEQDVVCGYPTFAAAESTAVINDNVWIVSRAELQGDLTAANRYSVIVVHGAGHIDVLRDEAALAFTAVAEGTEFAGWTDTAAILSPDRAADKNYFGSSKDAPTYTAEFLTTQLYTTAQLQVLLDLLAMDYKAEATDYTLCADIEIDADNLDVMANFRGVLDGDFYTLRPVDGTTAAIFGSMQGATLRNITIDCTAINDGTYLLAPDAAAVLQQVAVLFDNAREDARLQDRIEASACTMQSVYVVTSNRQTLENKEAYVQLETGVLYAPDGMTLQLGRDDANGMTVTAPETDTRFFVGWTEWQHDELAAGTQATLALSGKVRLLTANYIGADIATPQDMDTLADAVAKGFAFEGKTFALRNDIEIAPAMPVASTAGTVFAGTIQGNAHTVTVQNGKPFFGVLGGGLENMIVYAAGLAETVQHARLIDVVVIAADSDIATGSLDTATGVWLVTTAAQVDSAVSGVNVLYAPADQVTLTVGITDAVRVDVAAIDEFGGFIVWRMADGRVYDNALYGSLIDDGQQDAVLTVGVQNTIENVAELSYYGVALAHGFAGTAYLSSDITIDSAIVPLSGDVFLNGNGHRVTIAEDGVTLLDGMSASGALMNMIIDVMSGVGQFTLHSASVGSMTGVVVKRQQSTAVQMAAGNINNSWLIDAADRVAVADLGANYAAIDADWNVLRYSGGTIDVLFAEETTIRASALPDSYFVGYAGTFTATGTDVSATGTGVRLQAYFAPAALQNEAQWNELAQALQDCGNSAAGMSFALSADIEFTGALHTLVGFGGHLDGRYNNLVIQAGTSVDAQGPVALAEGGTVRGLAVELTRGVALPAGDDEWFVGACEQCWIVNYGVWDTRAHGAARMLTVLDGEGSVDLAYIAVDSNEQGFVFVPNDLSEYKLHYYERTDTGEQVESPTLPGATYDVTAVFDNCYTVYVQVVGVGEDVQAPQVEVLNANLWKADAGGVAEIRAKRGAGFVFLGFEYDSGITAVHPGDSCMQLQVRAAELTGSITVYARYMLLTSAWQPITYGDMTSEELNEYLVLTDEVLAALAQDSGYTVTRFVASTGDTLPTVDGLPYHAGGYEVRFDVRYNGEPVGESDSLVFTVAPRALYFKEIVLQPRKYNRTADAVIDKLVLAGFTDADAVYASYLDTSGVQLQYFDAAMGSITANAGTWNLVVKSGSVLDSTNDAVFFGVDYCLPEGVLYRYAVQDGTLVQDSPYTAVINKQVLNLTVNSLSIDYLQQFGRRNEQGIWIPFAIRDVLTYTYQDSDMLSAEDKAIIDSANLLLIDGDHIETVDGKSVYRYTWKPVGTYDIYTNIDALANYEPHISEGKAVFNVVRSQVEVQILDGNVIQYGDTLTSLRYNLLRDADGDGIYSDVVGISQEEFDAADYTLGLTYTAWLDALAVRLAPVGVWVDGQTVPFGTPGVGTYAVVYRYLADNANTELADSGDYTPVAPNNDYEAIAEGVLQVVPRPLTYAFTAEATKLFGDSDKAMTGRATGKGLVAGDKLTFVRDAGELVGQYALHPVVTDSEGNDVSDRYAMTPENGSGYLYTVAPRQVTVKRIGVNQFYYGSAELSDMPFALSVSQEVQARIVTALGGHEGQALTDLVGITVGYFGDRQDVGVYTTVEVKLSKLRATTDELWAQLQQCLTLSLDTSTATYTVLPARLVLTATDVQRNYDRTADLSGLSVNSVRVSGWVGDDANYLSVYVERFDCETDGAAGVYMYRPTGCRIEKKAGVSGHDNLLGNYTIGQVIDGRYTINKLSVEVDAYVGYYAEDGSFTEIDEVNFGDDRADWYFECAKLPGVLADLYEQADPQTQQESSRLLVDLLSIKAQTVGSLAAGSYVSTDKDDYSPYCADYNLNVKWNVYDCEILAVRYILTNVQLTAKDKYSLPDITFVVAMQDSYGNAVYGYAHANESFTLAAGQEVYLTDVLKVRYNVQRADNDMYGVVLQPYVKNGDKWYVYKQNEETEDEESNAVVYVQQQQGLIPADKGIQSASTVRPDAWQSLAETLRQNIAAVVGGVIGGVVLLVGVTVLGVYLNRRKRIRNRALHEMRYDRIVERIAQDESKDTVTADTEAEESNSAEQNGADNEQ